MIFLARPYNQRLNRIAYTPVAHSCAKETSQLGTGELWCNRNAEICVFTGPDPYSNARVTTTRRHEVGDQRRPQGAARQGATRVSVET